MSGGLWLWVERMRAATLPSSNEGAEYVAHILTPERDPATPARSRPLPPRLIGATMAGLTQVEPSETGSQVERRKVLTPGERWPHFRFGFFIITATLMVTLFVILVVASVAPLLGGAR